MARRATSLSFVLLFGLLIATAMCIGGCYTIEGVGRDVEATGVGLSSGAQVLRGSDGQEKSRPRQYQRERYTSRR